MSANVQILELTSGAAGVDKTGGTVRFKSVDETVVDTNNRLQIPPSGTTYSYTKQFQFNFQTAPSVDIQNLRTYSDGANSYGTGIGLQYDTPGVFASNVNTNIAGTDIFTKTSVSTLSLGAGPFSGTGLKGSILRLQMSVASTASNGQLSAETVSFAYDET